MRNAEPWEDTWSGQWLYQYYITDRSGAGNYNPMYWLMYGQFLSDGQLWVAKRLCGPKPTTARKIACCIDYVKDMDPAWDCSEHMFALEDCLEEVGVDAGEYGGGPVEALGPGTHAFVALTDENGDLWILDSYNDIIVFCDQ
jgi:hypothetical protein